MTNSRFSVLHHEYMNTGGGCMVSIFAVYDREAKAQRYVIANSEGFNWQTMDNVCNEPPEDISFDDIIISSWDWDVLNWRTYESVMRISIEEYELFKYCQFEFYKKDHCTVQLTVDELPQDMLKMLTADAVTWHIENEEFVTTDGYTVTLNPLYDDAVNKRLAEELQQIKDFLEWYDGLVSNKRTDEELEKLYNENVKITVSGRTVEIPFNADTYNQIYYALQEVIKEW